MKSNRHIIKLCITGGHITPAIALIEEIRQTHPDWHLVCIGRQFNLEGERIESDEVRMLHQYRVRFLALSTGRFTRIVAPSTLWSLVKFPIGCIQAFWYLLREKPDMVVSFGGYIALPVVISAALLGIPSITHEQTHMPGLTNRIIAHLVKRVYVSFPEVCTLFPKGKCILTGLPIRRAMLRPPPSVPYRTDPGLPLIVLTGGSTGAVSLNSLLFPLIRSLTKTYTIVHQTGNASFSQAQRVRLDLPKHLRERYVIAPSFESGELSWFFHKAIMVIARAGANTVGELATLGKVALLVPLPWSSGQEQQKNAQWLAQNGGALVLDQNHLSPKLLEDIIKSFLRHQSQYQKKADNLSGRFPRDGARQLMTEVEHIASDLWQSRDA